MSEIIPTRKAIANPATCGHYRKRFKTCWVCADCGEEFAGEYSPGPWTTSTEADGNTYLRDANGVSLMCDETYYPWVPSNKADWNLMASAPEMYEALIVLRRNLLRAGGDPMPTLDVIIAKAEGRA